MRVLEHSTKTLDNQVIDQILESSNTQINIIYSKNYAKSFCICAPAALKYSPVTNHFSKVTI